MTSVFNSKCEIWQVENERLTIKQNTNNILLVAVEVRNNELFKEEEEGNENIQLHVIFWHVLKNYNLCHITASRFRYKFLVVISGS